MQKRDGEFIAPCLYSAWEGFRFLGLEVESFEEEQLEDLSLARDTIVIGWVRVVQKAFRLLEIPIPKTIDYPEQLNKYLGRKIWKTTLKDIHQDWSDPVFIKPVTHKAFTGHTVERFSHLCETSNLDMSQEVWASEILNFESEFRCFVFENNLVGFKHYLGDDWQLPSKKKILEMIKSYSDSPIAYSLDVGIANGETYLVEVNDCYSLGNYGFNSITYCEMVEARLEEIVGS